MDADFWHQRWQGNRIGFHERAGNAMLARHFDALSLSPGARVFVPLCGKSRDIGWLMSRGCRVVGAELSELAIEQLFGDLDITPQTTALDGLTRYSGPDVDIFVGDIFDVTAGMVGALDAVYDRAALVALPECMRADYAAHVHAIAAAARQLLISLEYDQTLMDGPPFSIDAEELRRVYGAHYDLSLLESSEVAGGLKGICPAQEAVWLLR